MTTTKTMRNGPGTARKIGAEYVLSHSTFAEIPLTDLVPVLRPETGLNETHRQRIRNSFNYEELDFLVVNKRTWKKTTEFGILDGNHRYYAMDDLGIASAPCRVVEIDREREPELIIALNRKRIAYGQLDTFAQEVAMKNPAALEIVRVADHLGISERKARDLKSAANSPISEGTMNATEFNERIDRLERRLDEIARDTADTAERIRERFPNNQEVAEAVDRFISEALRAADPGAEPADVSAASPSESTSIDREHDVQP